MGGAGHTLRQSEPRVTQLRAGGNARDGPEKESRAAQPVQALKQSGRTLTGSQLSITLLKTWMLCKGRGKASSEVEAALEES